MHLAQIPALHHCLSPDVTVLRPERPQVRILSAASNAPGCTAPVYIPLTGPAPLANRSSATSTRKSHCGIVSGGITLATLAPIGLHLADTLEQAHFDYDEESFRTDWQQVIEVIEQEESANAQPEDSSTVKERSKFKIQPPSWFKRVNSPQKQEKNAEPSAMDELRKAKQLLDDGVLISEEFAQAKARILEAMGTK